MSQAAPTLPTPPGEQLPPDEVHLWLCDPADFDASAHYDLYRSWLSPKEREQHQKFRFERDRVLYLVAHAAVRSLLSRYHDAPPGAWVYRTNEYGRPDVHLPEEARSLRYNLSHTHGLIAVGLTRDREIGADVERVARDSDLISIADRFFSESEVRALHRLPKARHRDRFFDLWTLKESYIKGRGMGLSLPLGAFSFDLDSPSISIGFDHRIDDAPNSWRFWLLDPSASHRGAVAVRAEESEPMTLHVGRWLPAEGDAPAHISLLRTSTPLSDDR